MADPTFVAEATPHTSHMSCENGHEWSEKWPMPMTLTEFAERMRAASKCPTCGAPTFLGGVKGKPHG